MALKALVFVAVSVPTVWFVFWVLGKFGVKD